MEKLEKEKKEEVKGVSDNTKNELDLFLINSNLDNKQKNDLIKLINKLVDSSK